ncbi:hypothetical protein EJ04DRAFT_326448 [Polyplosphaeria fusca]|uniref:SET domain-containing protein n=1 Tax=Polyplosphaeria fusca TaxID=682080 RepID=A0A9P4R953_9PLEO|nr:hypothetical protein EJ04DRAFT_326448 [Polyplosphaeria fusca]
MPSKQKGSPDKPRSAGPKIPKGWPQGLLYLHAPVYSKKLAVEAHNAVLLASSDAPDAGQRSSACRPHTNVKITKIISPSHPADGQHGLFASQPLAPDTLILPYLGYVHDKNDTNPASDYDLSLDRDYGIGVDASEMGNEARFINDYRGVSGAPNADFREIYVDSDNGRVEKRMGVFVLSAGKSGKRAKGIAKGEEILVSYGKGFWTEREKKQD